MLRIEMTKPPDGGGVLRCTWQDGSVTWQKRTRHAAHFAWQPKDGTWPTPAAKARAALFPPRPLKWNGWLASSISNGVPVSSGVSKSLMILLRGHSQLRRFSGSGRFAGRCSQHWSAVTPGQKLELQFEVPSAASS